MIARVANGSPRAGITGAGAYIPERVLTNADLEQMDGTLEAGQIVLMSAVGAGLSWGPALLVWGDAR